eukprot:Awhi_evm1s5611
MVLITISNDIGNGNGISTAYGVAIAIFSNVSIFVIGVVIGVDIGVRLNTGITMRSTMGISISINTGSICLSIGSIGI